MLLALSNSLWQMGYKKSELAIGRSQSLHTATVCIQSINESQASGAESVATDQGRTVCTEDGASGESHTLNTPSQWEKPLSCLIWMRRLVLLLSCLTA